MKKKLSISIDENTLLKILNSIKQGRFRNKSHAVEYALNTLLRK